MRKGLIPWLLCMTLPFSFAEETTTLPPGYVSTAVLKDFFEGFSKLIASNCSGTEYTCESGKCVNITTLCDSVLDCEDGSDETSRMCNYLECTSQEFKCNYGACIELNKTCDGVNDCWDASDEELCTKPNRGCKLPLKDEGTNYTVKGCPSDQNTLGGCQGAGSWVREYTYLAYICSKGYALTYNQDTAVCVNGAWVPDKVKCQKMCKPLASKFMDLSCYYFGQSVDCNRPALQGTKVYPRCKVAHKASTPSKTFRETECTPFGEWGKPLFKCEPVACRPFSDYYHDVKCTYLGQPVDCGLKVRPGTKAWPKCKAGHHLNNKTAAFEFTECTLEGKWEPPIFKCAATCGWNYVENARPPWDAVLYFNNSNSLPVCGGTVISKSHVITAAHCVFDEKVNAIINSANVTVVIGKHSKGWNETEQNEQRIGLKRIVLPTMYRGARGNYQHDIALLVLSQRVIFSSSVSPICVYFWTETPRIENGELGMFACWRDNDENGTNSKGLVTAKVPYKDKDTCRHQSPESFQSFITNDKFCTGSENDDPDSAFNGDAAGRCSGSGVTFQNGDGIWYLYGVLSVGAFNSSVFAYTDVEQYINWITNSAPFYPPSLTTSTTKRPVRTTTISSSLSCKLPQKAEGTIFKVEGCQSGSREDSCQGKSGTRVRELTALSFSCDQGYALPLNLNTNYSIISLCKDGSWLPEEVKCQKMCEALFSESLDLHCTFRGERVDCDRLALPGTKVFPRCKRSYEELKSWAVFRETECAPDGRWKLPLFECVPECGRKGSNSAKPLVANGTTTKIGEYPWHAGLYLYEKIKKVPTFTYVCGGTIITTRLVLTAAHCVYINDLRIVVKERTLTVVVGKYHRSWNVTGPFEQRIGVREIVLPEAYAGVKQSYVQDIAILLLSCSIVLSDAVLPVCVDWSSNKAPVNGMLGTVVGWGEDENSKGSEVLKAAQLPYMDRRTCELTAPEKFYQYVTYDKFCAHSVNGTSVQRGDSGGGMTFEIYSNKLHYLYGVVSSKPVDTDSFAAYTDIRFHIDWLFEVKQRQGAFQPCHAPSHRSSNTSQHSHS